MESPAGSEYSESELRSAAIELAAGLRDQFRSIKRPGFAAQLERVHEALVESDTRRAVAIWKELVPRIPAAVPRRRMLPIRNLTGTLARALSELTGSHVPEPDFDAPAPGSLSTAVKRCVLILFGAAALAFGIVIVLLPPRVGVDEIARIACGVLFIISGPVCLVRALTGDHRRVDEEFTNLLDGL